MHIYVLFFNNAFMFIVYLNCFSCDVHQIAQAIEYDQMININEILGLSSNVSGLFRFIFFFNFKTVGKESYSHCP